MGGKQKKTEEAREERGSSVSAIFSDLHTLTPIVCSSFFVSLVYFVVPSSVLERSHERYQVGLFVLRKLQLEDQVEELDGVLQR